MTNEEKLQKVIGEMGRSFADYLHRIAEEGNIMDDLKDYIQPQQAEHKKPARRRAILEEAMRCVCTDRNEQYGEPEDNFAVIGKLWAVYLQARCVSDAADVCIESEDVCNLMVLFKVGRAATALTQKADTYIDMAGYAACAGGMAEDTDGSDDE